MRHALLMGALLVAVAASARAADEPALQGVTPVRVDDTLAADVRTEHLPGARLESSLASGLPSAIELHLEAYDRKNKRVAEDDLFWRITWDLWDEMLHVEGPGEDRRFPDLASLRTFLTDLRDLPVASWGSIDPNAEHRLRARCRLHPVAPRETERLSQWVSGEEPARRGDTDSREVSVGLGEVIRFFYKGAARDADELDERFSAWFVPAALPDTSGEGAR